MESTYLVKDCIAEINVSVCSLAKLVMTLTLELSMLLAARARDAEDIHLSEIERHNRPFVMALK